MTQANKKVRPFLMRSPVRRNRYRRTACAVATTLLLSACANTALERAPRSPDTPWQAGNRARQAALSAGMVEATFLPMLSANVVGGYQRARYPLPENITGIRDINTELNGVVPALALGWLIFDFGQRKALYDAASELSFAQNVLFNAAHQKVIRDVTDQFYQYSMARTRRTLSASMLINQQKVLTERTIDPRGVRGTRRGQHPVQALAPSLWI